MAKRFTIELNDAEEAKLASLARTRGKSEEQCVRDFIAACQPGGSGWSHPELAAQPKKGGPS